MLAERQEVEARRLVEAADAQLAAALGAEEEEEGGTPALPDLSAAVATAVRRGGEALDSTLKLATAALPRLASFADGTPRGRGEGAEEEAARATLVARLELYGVRERVVVGDGACQFRALSDQLYGDEKYHAVLREVVCRQLEKTPSRYDAFLVGESLRDFAARQSRADTWGDHVTLQAAADAFGCSICVLTSYDDEGVVELDPAVRTTERTLWLSFWAEVHYNSLEPIAGA